MKPDWLFRVEQFHFNHYLVDGLNVAVFTGAKFPAKPEGGSKQCLNGKMHRELSEWQLAVFCPIWGNIIAYSQWWEFDIHLGLIKVSSFFLNLCLEGEKKKSCLKHLEVMCSVPSRSLLHPSYYHSFGVTENYIVFIEQPFKLDIPKLATAYFRGVNWASCLSFHKDNKVLFC